MKFKEFDDYEKACAFRDEVNGETNWKRCYEKGHWIDYWIVWYEI